MTHYLLTYDRHRRELAAMQRFHDAHEAHVAYAALEDRFPEDDHFEVVLLGAKSVKTLMVTHPRYFTSVAEGVLVAD